MKKFSEFKRPIKRLYEQDETQAGFSAAQMVSEPLQNKEVEQPVQTEPLQNKEEQPKLEASNMDVSKFFSKIFES